MDFKPQGIYLLTFNKDNKPRSFEAEGQAIEFVIAASDAERARELASKNEKLNGMEMHHANAWRNTQVTDCVHIGMTNHYEKETVIVRNDFEA